MTQDPYNNDVPLAADVNESADEFDGLEVGAEQPKNSKTPVFALIGLILVAGAAFLTYQVFLASPEDEMPIAVAPHAMPMAQTPSADATGAPPVPGMENPALPEGVSSATAPTTTDPTAVTAEALPSTPPVPDATTPPVADASAAVTPPTEIAPAPTETAKAPEPTAPVVPAAPTPEASAAPLAPAPVAPATSALPTPPVEQLKPIDPNAVMDKAVAPTATTLPAGNPQVPSSQKTVDTINAVNDILGSNVANSAQNAVSVQTTDANIAKQVEVTPRAKQVIFVKKNYSASSPQAVVATGDRVMQAGQYGDAAEIYDRQLKKNPSDPLALAGKALAQQKAGQTTQAMDTYQRLLDLNPRDIEALTNYLGLLQKQNPTEALSRLQALTQQYPESAAVAGQLATTQAGMMDTPNALRNFQKAAALDPTNPTYAFNLGVLYDRLGTTSKARDSYRMALDLAREYPERASGVPLEIIRNRLGNLSQ